MCLAVPGLLERIDESSQPRMGTVSFGGVRKDVCVEWVPDVRTGQYVIVHAGFAISVLDESEAKETLKLIDEMEAQGDSAQSSEPHR